MNLVLILDQIQAGAGTKDDTLVPLQLSKEKIGPSLMMEQILKKYNANIKVTLFCGTKTFTDNKEEITRKLVAMCQKLNADVVMCGPCYNYEAFASMAAYVTKSLKDNNIKAFCAMSEENASIIEEYKNNITIVKMPKKGGIGLSESLNNMLQVSNDLLLNKEIDSKIIY